VPTKMLASLVLGQQSLKNIGLKGAKLLPWQRHRIISLPGPSLHAENNSDKIFNIMGEGSDPSDNQNDKIQNNIGPSENQTVL